MATAFKNKLATGLGITPTTVITTNSAANTTVIGFSLTNTTGGIIQVSILLQDTINVTSAYFMKNITVAPNTSVRAVTGGEKLILSPSTNVIINSTSDSSVDLVMSWVEIS
jgi:hypothetical protein